MLSAAVAGMCDAVAARVRGNIRTTTRVSPGRQPSVWVRCAMLTAALQDWVGSGGVYAGSLQISTGGSSSWEFALSAGEAGATVGRLADYKCWLPSHRYLKQPDRCAMKQSGDVVWSEGGGILLDPARRAAAGGVVSILGVVGQRGMKLAMCILGSSRRPSLHAI